MIEYFITGGYNVSTILSKFTKAIDSLEAAVDYHAKEADKYAEQALQAKTAEIASQKEADRAGSVAAKLRKLLEVD